MKKLGRPKKVNYDPKITISLNEDVLYQALSMKKAIGGILTMGELEYLINHDLVNTGVVVKLQITKVKKLSWIKKLINLFRRK